MDDETQWRPGDPVYERPEVDTEIAAVEAIVAAFGSLDKEACARVLRWAADRYTPEG